MPPVGFESTVSAGELPQTYALDRAATGTGVTNKYKGKILLEKSVFARVIPEFLAFYETRGFATMFLTVRHWTRTEAKFTHSTSHAIFL